MPFLLPLLLLEARASPVARSPSVIPRPIQTKVFLPVILPLPLHEARASPVALSPSGIPVPLIRSSNKKEDYALAKELLLNDKERAEHLMLVDLERNDLGRICEIGTVQVTDFMLFEK